MTTTNHRPAGPTTPEPAATAEPGATAEPAATAEADAPVSPPATQVSERAGPAGRRGRPGDRVAQAELRQGAVPRPAAAGPDRPVAAARPGRARPRPSRSWPSSRAFAATTVDGAQIERDARIPDEVLQRPGRARRVRHEDRREVRRARSVQSGLLPGADAGRLGQPVGRRAAVGAPVDRRAAAAEAVRHRRSRSRQFLPRLAAGEVSAFLLTEPDVGSDPARLRTTADAESRAATVLNGVKLWATNGTVATLLVVMARVPQVRRAPGRHHRVRGRGRLPRASPSSGATRSWACAAWRTASPASTTSSCPRRT